MQNLKVTEKYDKKNVSKILFDTFPALTKNTLYKAFRQKDIKINGKRTSKDIPVYLDDEVQIYVVDSLLLNTLTPHIVYEDDNILVVDKPSEIEVVGENSLTSCLKSIYPHTYIEPCHRLDRNTNGLVLFAKNEKALNVLLDKFKNHEIKKHYIAKVYGIPKKENQTLTAYLFKDSKKSMVYISDEPKKGYSKIITSYYTIEKHIKENYSILDVTLHTGKTHQIRAHLAHIGLPILGDGKYGNNQVNKKFGYKFQQLTSYSLKFVFTTDADILNYLNGKEFKLDM